MANTRGGFAIGACRRTSVNFEDDRPGLSRAVNPASATAIASAKPSREIEHDVASQAGAGAHLASALKRNESHKNLLSRNQTAIAFHLLRGRPAAIDRHQRPGHERCFVRGKVPHQRCNLFRFPAANRLSGRSSSASLPCCACETSRDILNEGVCTFRADCIHAQCFDTRRQVGASSQHCALLMQYANRCLMPTCLRPSRCSQ